MGAAGPTCGLKSREREFESGLGRAMRFMVAEVVYFSEGLSKRQGMNLLTCILVDTCSRIKIFIVSCIISNKFKSDTTFLCGKEEGFDDLNCT